MIFCTFGDAMRVPGKTARFCRRKPAAPMSASFTRRWTLCGWRSKIRSARWSFGLGFETTMPATALTLRQARERNVDNFYFFCQHITLLPTLRSLLDQPENGIDAFLAPGHVSMVIGTEAYGFIASDYHRPLVVAGFEPLDLLQGAVMLVEQTIAQRSDVENQYRRVVPDEGNPLAQAAMADVFRPDGDSEWRGLGSSATPACSLRQPISASMPRRIFARRRSACATTRAPAAARC